MREGEKVREGLLIQGKELEELGKASIARTCVRMVEKYNMWHKLGEAFMSETENRKKDFYIHCGLADTDRLRGVWGIYVFL